MFIFAYIKNETIMRYLHYITDLEGNQIESNYSPNAIQKISMVCLAKIKNAKYQIWDRETNEIITLNIN
jgi:hypothetical protein